MGFVRVLDESVVEDFVAYDLLFGFQKFEKKKEQKGWLVLTCGGLQNLSRET